MSRQTADFTLLVVGKIKPPHAAAAALYEERVARYATIDVIEVASEQLGGGDGVAAKREGDRLRAKLPDRAYRIALSPKGRLPKSDGDFARRLARRREEARPCVFLIGGASGLAADLEDECEERLSLGPLTLPHQLARVVLAEQIYRALAAGAGHPYAH